MATTVNQGKRLLEFTTPQHLKDAYAQALKNLPNFSISDQYQRISEAKARGEDPMKTVYQYSDEEIATSRKQIHDRLAERKKEGVLWEVPERPMSVSDEEEDDQARDARRQAKSDKRKGAELSVGSASNVAPAFTGRSRSATVSSTEGLLAESPQPTIGRTPPNMLHAAAATAATAEQPKAVAVKDEVKRVYKAYPLPGWLKDISVSGLARALKQTNRDRTQALRSIEAFKDCMRRCEDAATTNKPDALKEKLFEELRNHVHKAEILLKGVDKFVVRKHNMLTVDNGLPRIFMAQKADYPWDLQADAWQLYVRWYNQDFATDLLRGIITKTGKDRTSDSIDPKWPKTRANYHGEGNLVVGQWWPTQLCTVRDGAHGAPQAGIFGEKGQGAYSIVLAGGGYKDTDDGDEIWYSGTGTKTNEPTENTQRMIELCEEFPDRPVRVLRSMGLHTRNPYRPTSGFRYDGLYRVVGMERLEEGKEDYRFKLVRLSDQLPIRCEDNAARRPTKYEEAEFKRLKENGR
ncbi:hypothetical protein BU23DRAFT_118061 [Bimuria novae-zelandiae CBS 107.79]|uniref:YDG domain-containing protein n=1 Tax=Bimuria novae-zelandiae CBS 107.79 TaxID=1447943 RepID=A0A6A5V9Q1_9PLEO|nr:hypothetical protein BU23DRAFT_118061 [Bimuria novae-zelandiae CBS 107.79]